MRTIRIASVIAALVGPAAVGGLGGCAGSVKPADDGAVAANGAALHLGPGRYGAAFDRARDVLRDLGFILDRVDAQLGVIATLPKGTGGIATPWDQEQSGIGDELEDAVQKHSRVVRIEFTPVGTDAGGVDASDLRTDRRPIGAQVSVTIYRINQPGWRLDTQAILRSTYTHDPQLDARGMGAYSVAVRQDHDLAERIARSVRERLERRTAAR